jgi:7-cyano-7-deazaguanine synthase
MIGEVTRVTNAPVVIISGGLDSTVLAYDVHEYFGDVRLVSFDYGQRHDTELEYARLTAHALGAQHTIINVRSIGRALAGSSALVDFRIPVPDGHYAADTMKSTIVPNRNMIMLSIAAGIAQSEHRDRVYFAVHSGDHFIYPDCRPIFVQRCDQAIRAATDGAVTLHAPFVFMSKAEIVTRGVEVGARFDDTWSCYKGGDVHCGSCGTCFERREAFCRAGVDDPTPYLLTPQYAAPEVIE